LGKKLVPRKPKDNNTNSQKLVKFNFWNYPAPTVQKGHFFNLLIFPLIFDFRQVGRDQSNIQEPDDSFLLEVLGENFEEEDLARHALNIAAKYKQTKGETESQYLLLRPTGCHFPPPIFTGPDLLVRVRWPSKWDKLAVRYSVFLPGFSGQFG